MSMPSPSGPPLIRSLPVSPDRWSFESNPWIESLPAPPAIHVDEHVAVDAVIALLAEFVVVQCAQLDEVVAHVADGDAFTGDAGMALVGLGQPGGGRCRLNDHKRKIAGERQSLIDADKVCAGDPGRIGEARV